MAASVQVSTVIILMILIQGVQPRKRFLRRFMRNYDSITTFAYVLVKCSGVFFYVFSNMVCYHVLFPPSSHIVSLRCVKKKDRYLWIRYRHEDLFIRLTIFVDHPVILSVYAGRYLWIRYRHEDPSVLPLLIIRHAIQERIISLVRIAIDICLYISCNGLYTDDRQSFASLENNLSMDN